MTSGAIWGSLLARRDFIYSMFARVLPVSTILPGSILSSAISTSIYLPGFYSFQRYITVGSKISFLVKTLTVSHLIPEIRAWGPNMILWTVLILGFTYMFWPTLVHIICSLCWKTLCRLWEDLQGVVQSATVRRVVCQAVLGSLRTAGTTLILPCIVVERL